jgi:serine/threonine protein kinase
MSVNEARRVCPSCQKPLAPDVPLGLCPECLIKSGFLTGTEPGTGGPGESKFVAPSVEDVRKLFPHLEVIAMIGRGGMGAVYKVRQKELDRVVALKILPPGIGDDRAFADRFVREAKALAKLSHSNIVTLYEFDQADGLFYFVMEFVDGVNLRQLLQAGRLAPREALAIVPQICDALQYAHDHGIVHRDIKPENILLDRKGQVKVADFGVARLMSMEGDVPGAESSQAGSASVSLTEAGKVMGTPQYMAPEQKERPTEVDHRADIYSLGVVFYQMLTGELPGKRIEAPARKFHLDVRLDEVVLRALEKEPARRYQQASQFKTQVETIAGTVPLPPPRRVLKPALIAGVATSLIIGILGMTVLKNYWRKHDSREGTTVPMEQSSPGHLMWGPTIERTIEPVAFPRHFSFEEILANKATTPGATFLDFDTGTFTKEFMPGDFICWDDSSLRFGWELASVAMSSIRWDATPSEVVQEIGNTPTRREEHILGAASALPETWFFATREGSRGILQIAGTTENPRSVTLRYKLVQNSAGKIAVLTPHATTDVREVAEGFLNALATGAFVQAYEMSGKKYEQGDARELEKVSKELDGRRLDVKEMLIAATDAAAITSFFPTREDGQVALGIVFRRVGNVWQVHDLAALANEKAILKVIAEFAKEFPEAVRHSSVGAQPQPNYLQAFALLESVKHLGHDLERAFDGNDAAAAKAVAPLFLEKCCAYDASVHGTEFESPKTFIGIIQKVVKALNAGDWERAKVEFNEIQKGQFSGTINYEHLKKLAEEIDAAEVQRIIGNSPGATSPENKETTTPKPPLRNSSTLPKTSPKPPSLKTMAFGPVIERVLPDAEAKTGYEAADLRTGKFISLPEHSTDELMVTWLATNRVDLIAAWDPDPEDRNRIYLQCIKGRLSDFDNQRWANATPEECLAALKSVTTLQPLDENRIDEDLAKAGVTVYLLPPKIQLPRALAFQTREGISGLLQITGYTEKPRGVKIRYKLVTNPATTSAHTLGVELLTVERHTRQGVTMWQPDGSEVPDQLRALVGKFDVMPPEDNGRPKYVFSLVVQNPPDDSLIGYWSATFGDGSYSPSLAGRMEKVNHPPEVKGTLLRLATSFAKEKAATDVRVGFAVKPWRDVLTVEAPGFEATQRDEPFKKSTPKIEIKATEPPARFPPDPSLGKVATQVELHMPEKLRWEWDWHIGVFDRSGREVFPDQFPPMVAGTKGYIDSSTVAELFYVAKDDVRKVVVQARSYEQDYEWTEFQDVALRPKKEAKAASGSPATLKASTKTNALGPIIERVLPFGEPCAMKYLQFHTGNVIAIGDGPGDKSDHSEEYRRAEESGGLDGSAMGLENGVQFAGHGCVFLAAADSNDWDMLTAESMVWTLQRGSWFKGVIEVYDKDFPATYLFKTARGECGILQILGLTDEKPHPSGMKLRCTLVKGAPRPTKEGFGCG